jgi:ATP/maltotriose-dependent transcriptional regulator MalT
LQEQEINAHKAQLADFQENITNKNALIDEMQAQMNELLINATCITQSEAERNREKLDELKVLTEKDWRVYLTHFEKAYPGYIAKVEQHFPDLTKGELRFFLVIYLGLSKDELATFLGISLDGVNKNQYRLKKKLGLGEESSLREFIKKF